MPSPVAPPLPAHLLPWAAAASSVGSVGVGVAAAAQERGKPGEHRQGGGEGEHLRQAVVECPGDEVWEELPAGDDELVGSPGSEDSANPVRLQRVLQRVDAEQGRKQGGGAAAELPTCTAAGWDIP